MIDTTLIKQRFEALSPVLDERMRRLWAAAEAKAIGHGGIRAVQRLFDNSGLTAIRQFRIEGIDVG